ncbi:GDSL-type esterase/lipase family protein [Bacillus sp. FJAT-27251]|uniref:GDSL-type esterase/lipase family protein n=1 Tax=Bacillus sp. FJAT-27251 TaxID=1684142 RepID=UPI0006A759EB|nr:GDSL-type esterase/lipase family protein [Bacillus sp. FJAT-27251]
MKVLKYTLATFVLIGSGAAAWFYYPQYQINKMKEELVETGTDYDRQTYLDYFRQSSDSEIHHLALGDSVIHGFGANETENLVYKFSSQLGVEINKTVHYSNKGKNGLTSSELNRLVQNGVFDEEIRNSDIITINIGGNDVLKLAKKQDFYTAIKSFDTLQSSFASNLTEISAKIKKLNPHATIVFLELYNPLPVDHQIYNLADQLLPKWNLKIYEVAQQVPASLVIETTRVINSQNPQNLSADGVHPNVSGYAAITEQMLNQFKKEYRRHAV